MAETQHDEAHEEEVKDLDEADEVIPCTYAITSYGADYPVDFLIRRLQSEEIVVPTFAGSFSQEAAAVGLQREYVWPKPKADKFIESLLLGLPVPGIFLVQEASGRLLVLDGHQRLHTLRSYYEGRIRGEKYRLTNVQERFRDKLFDELDAEDRRRIDDSIIHATVVRQDVPTEDQSSIYMIFERLNTGGVSLRPQEIRVALYHGELVRVLKALNEESPWRQLYGIKSNRLKDMEMIVRFFAFYYCSHDYNRPMKDFLNRYMASNRNLERQPEAELQEVFRTTTSVLEKALGRRAFRPKGVLNAAVADSLMVGVASRVKHGSIRNLEDLQDRYEWLIADENYLRAIETGTSDETNVETRMSLAKKAFAEVV